MRMIFGDHQQNTIDQFLDVESRAEHAALMADGHLGYVMPVGGVAAYRNKVSVVGVGFDIACGNAAIMTDRLGDSLTAKDVQQLADEIQATISFGVGRTCQDDTAPVNHPLFESPVWDAIPEHAREDLRNKARSQLGTVGSGNHYVDVFIDEHNRVWIGVHFGSRGLGHTIASGVMALAANQQWGARVPEQEVLLDLDTPLGQAYWDLMNLAGVYAYAGREWVARRVVGLLGASEVNLVHNHHNFAWKERHFGEEFVVVRKGATPAFPGQRGFVGGSMGDESAIIEGTGEGLSERALFSTVHGAGRVMSRTQAAGRRNRRTGEIRSPGLVSPEMMNSWLAEAGVVLRGGGLDESPHAYRRIVDVLAAQGETIRVLHALQPIVVVMAGANEFDPYKD